MVEVRFPSGSALLTLFLCVFCRVSVELFLAARGTEVVFPPPVLAREFRGLLIHGHFTDRIDSPTRPQSFPFLNAGKYLFIMTSNFCHLRWGNKAWCGSPCDIYIPRDG